MQKLHYRPNLPTLRHHTPKYQHYLTRYSHCRSPQSTWFNICHFFSVVTECEKRIGAAASGYCSDLDPTVPPSGERDFPLSARWRTHSEAGELGQRTIEGECMAKMRKKNAMQLFSGGALKEFGNAEFIHWGKIILNCSMEGLVALNIFTGLWLAYCEPESETIIRAKHLLTKYVSCFLIMKTNSWFRYKEEHLFFLISGTLYSILIFIFCSTFKKCCFKTRIKEMYTI